MNPNTETLLSHLNKVRDNGNGRWNACCPAHADRSPSLSIRETDDGRILLHCFAGCDVAAVVAAVGMRMDDLFPPRPKGDDGYKPVRAPFNATDVLYAIRTEAEIVAIAADMIVNGLPLGKDDAKRVEAARDRIYEALTLTGNKK